MPLHIKPLTIKILIGLLSALISIVLLQVALSPWYLFGINIDNSLPGILYLVIRDDLPSRHEVAAFHTPPNPYYPEGAPFIKIVRGLPGDRVSRDGQNFFINNRLIGTAKTKTRHGQPLTPGPTGKIPLDHYFFWTPHIDSYDSRYGEIGWITTDQIMGRAVRLW